MRFTVWRVLLLSILSLVGLTHAALLGVDFGTEYTKAVLVAPNVPYDILLTSESKRKDVSGMALILDEASADKNGMAIRKYGTQALATCIKSPSSCVMYVKSLLGTGIHNELFDEYIMKFKGLGVGFQTDRKAATVVVSDKKQTNSQTFLIEEIVAMQLLEMKSRALQYWKERSPETVGEIDEVAISVPAFFTQAAKTALIDAAELAGMKVVALVDDGSAIALDYAQKRKQDIEVDFKEYHLIFDSGAGSTKATLVSLFKNGTTDAIDINVENYVFSHRLNGELYTIMVRANILESFAEETGIPIEELVTDAKTMWKAWQAAERAKLILSANTETNINIESFYNEIDFKGFMTRDDLESRMEIALSGIPQLLDAVFKVEGFDVQRDLTSVILAGGSVRVPSMQEALVNYLGGDEKISKNVNADESVVFGTTLRGAQQLKLTRKGTDFNIINKNFDSFDLHYKSNLKGGIVTTPRGLASNDKFQANLTQFSNEFIPEIQVDVIAEGLHLVQQYNFTMPKRFNETVCNAGVEYSLNYGYSKVDGAYNINNLKVDCFSDIGNGTIIPRHGNMHSVSKFVEFEPMTGKMKQISKGRLAELDRLEHEIQILEDTKNNLEGKLYELRYHVEDEEEKLPAEYVEELNTKIGEYLEWLDYDSEDASLKDVRSKYKEVLELINDLDLHVIVSDPSRVEALINEINLALNSGDVCVDKVLGKEQLLMKECEIYNIDYEAQVSKLHGSSWPNRDFEIKDDVKDVEDVRLLKKTLKEVNDLCKSYEEVYELRRDFVSQVLTNTKRKLKKEERKREAELKANQTTVGEITASESNTEKATENVSHDEL